MGITRFFYWIIKNHKDCLSSSAPINNIENLYLDFNSMIHNSLHKSYEQHSSYLKQFEELGNEMNKIVSLIKPSKLLFISIDGLASKAKQLQQKKRRLKNTSRDSYEPNKISPSTPFMEQINNYLELWIRNYINNNKQIKVVLSNDKVKGEGEHKIIEYINKEKLNSNL